MKIDFFKDLFYNVVSTIVGGMVLAFIFFLLSDIVFALPDLNGKWSVYVTVTETEYAPYQDLRLEFEVILEQHGDELFGFAEKIQETTKNGQITIYGRSDRVRSKIQGHIDGKYLLNDTAITHFTEEGSKRTTTTLQSLTIQNDNIMSGKYYSTSGSKGIVKWEKNF